MKESPSIRDVLTTLLRLATGSSAGGTFLRSLQDLGPEERARELRKRSQSIYSSARLASLFGTSKATAYRWTQKGEKRHG